MKFNLLPAFLLIATISILSTAPASAQSDKKERRKPNTSLLSAENAGDDSTATDNTEPEKKHRTGSIYVSWGYNQEWYTNSTVHVKQEALGNDYELVNVNGHDHMGWNNKSIFRQPITIPQYNYRIGYYFNEKQDMGIEINFDHTKFIIKDNQMVRVKGKRNGVGIDDSMLFSEKTGSYYYLNNGANFLLFNFVKRFGLYRAHNLAVDLVGKAGIGPVIPHVENSFFGSANDPHFQIGGWNAGLETALRVTAFRYGFIEISQKGDYARYSNLKIASGGTANHSFGTYELILSVGVTLPTTKNNPLFTCRKKG